MNYKDSIIEMVGTMENEEYLQIIYYFVKTLHEKDKKEI